MSLLLSETALKGENEARMNKSKAGVAGRVGWSEQDQRAEGPKGVGRCI